jgi:solute carrier family 12 sodium/potassium/chloride transporter 2
LKDCLKKLNFLKAFCDDHLVPYISWFGKGYGPARDPRHGYLVTFIIACIFIAIGDVNTAGVWISNFYLGAFFMVNFSLFHVAWINSISFRPSFKYYDKWISLIIGIFCIILMYLFDYVSASVVCGLTIIIYISMLFVDPCK